MSDVESIRALYAFAESAGLSTRVRVLRAGVVSIELDPHRPEPATDARALPESEPPSDLDVLLWSTGQGATPYVRGA